MYKTLSTLLVLSSGALSAPSRLAPRDSCTADPGFDTAKVLEHALRLSSHSWEYGTAAEALLEYYDPSYAVFSPGAFPNNAIPSPPSSIKSLQYAAQHIDFVSSDANGTLINGDGAAGDPASLGQSALLLGTSDDSYASAAAKQLAYLVDTVPRFPSGAISQRDTNLEAWADFMFMVPPFLAYSAVANNDVELLRESVRQCGLYRDILVNSDGDAKYWRHIVPGSDGSNNDAGIWSTGNAWAVSGMARVLGTLLHWSPSSSLSTEKDQLISWIKEIFDAAIAAGCDEGLLRNYLPDGSWFGETSGTALFAATVYRVALLAPDVFGSEYVGWADALRGGVAAHVDDDGILSPAVNPLGWGDRTPYTSGSPEGQSFGGMLGASYRDFVCGGGEQGM